MVVFPYRTGAASVGTLAGLVVGTGLLHLIAPGWCRQTGLDVWNYAAVEAERRWQDARGEELGDRLRRFRAQLVVGDHLAGELVAGRLSLADAADELARLNAGRGGFADGLAAAFPDAPDFRHRVARYAIRQGLGRLAGPDRAAAADRLEAEYAALGK